VWVLKEKKKGKMAGGKRKTLKNCKKVKRKKEKKDRGGKTFLGIIRTEYSLKRVKNNKRTWW